MHKTEIPNQIIICSLFKISLKKNNQTIVWGNELTKPHREMETESFRPVFGYIS